MPATQWLMRNGYGQLLSHSAVSFFILFVPHSAVSLSCLILYTLCLTLLSPTHSHPPSCDTVHACRAAVGVGSQLGAMDGGIIRAAQAPVSHVAHGMSAGAAVAGAQVAGAGAAGSEVIVAWCPICHKGFTTSQGMGGTHRPRLVCVWHFSCAMVSLCVVLSQ